MGSRSRTRVLGSGHESIGVGVGKWIVRLLGLALVSAAIGAGVALFLERDPGPIEQVLPRDTPSIFGRLSAELARSGSRLHVRNAGDHPWTSCIVDLNAGVDGGAFSHRIGEVGAGEQVEVRLASFARADGREFDPNTERVLVVDVHCDTPDGQAHFTGGL